MGMIRTQISMTEQQADALRRLATLRQRSQAALMRDALDALMADAERARRVDRARRWIGAFRSGPSTTSDDHDRLLAQVFST